MYIRELTSIAGTPQPVANRQSGILFFFLTPNHRHTMTTKPIYIGPPVEDYYICDCPKCKQGMHANPDRVKQYRERGQQIARLEAEVERLKEENELYRSANANVKRIAEERNKAETEVERLREMLNRSVEIQEEMCTGCRCYHCDDLRMELNAIKATLNQDDK